jgi:ubiquinone/menaquinone biosynthesis C-methylase UbiE
MKEADSRATLHIMNFSDPKTNLLQMGLREGMKVADIGAGTGHYTLSAAHLVGRSGKVYAIDVHQDILHHITDTVHRRAPEYTRTIETIWGNVEKQGGTKLRDGAIAAIILSNILFQLEHKEAAIKEIKRILAPSGKILVIDWAGAYAGMGPSPLHVISENAAEELFITNGFYKVKDFRAGAHHYGILFTSPEHTI